MKKPVIGITGAYVDHNHYMKGVYVHEDYHRAIIASGGIPLVLPYSNDEMAKTYVSMCDGILLSGGEDVDPQFYNQDPHQKLSFVNPERDRFELAVAKEALAQNKPLFGICRGLQLLNVVFGGTLIQDIPSQKPESMQHVQTIPRPRDFHSVEFDSTSWLAQTLETTNVRVNSLHHQAIQRIADDLKMVAWAGDGIIEAVEHRQLPHVFAVQWHPESMYATSEPMQKLFKAFVGLCEK